jgi:protein SCO1/2
MKPATPSAPAGGCRPAPGAGPPDRRRRGLLRLAAAAGAAPFIVPVPGRALGQHGRIEPPQAPPAVALLRDDGTRTTLARQLDGRVTALHFMFTGCVSTCPIQGAVFARVQESLAPRRLARVQLLSVSVDALGDDPGTLSRWRERHSAGPAWRAAVPTRTDVDRLTRWAGGVQPFAADTHATQVLLFDDRARLVFRTTDLPDPADVARLLVQLEALTRG